MSRHLVYIPLTEKIQEMLKSNFIDEPNEEYLDMYWGLDHDGYFIQISYDDGTEEIWIEDGLVGNGKSKIIEKLEYYQLLEFIRQSQPEHFGQLCLDLPF